MVTTLLLVACKGPDPAPTELEDLIGYMFNHTDDEDEAALSEGAANLDVWMDDNLDATLEGYDVNVLTEEDVEALGVGHRDLDGLEGVAVGYQHTADLDQIATSLMTDPTELHPDLYVSFDADMIAGDKEEFAADDIDWVEYQQHAVEALGLGITLDITSHLQYRRFDTPNGPAIVYRYWTVETPTVTTNLFALDQSYFIWTFIPHEDGSIRSMQASWVVARVLDDDLDSNLVMNLWVDGMVRGAGDLDETAQGGDTTAGE
jgi:hypothetical protein